MLDAFSIGNAGTMIDSTPASPNAAASDTAATTMKACAAQLLEELLTAKAAQSVGASRDLFAAVTGHSALDNAIAECRSIIASSERMLAATQLEATNGVAPALRLPAGRASIIATRRSVAV